MSEPIWALPFPGGVMDERGHLALWRDADGVVAALGLADGRILWRSTGGLWPLLVSDDLALALATAPARLICLSMHGTHAGQPRWVSPALPWPTWTQQLHDLDAGVQVDAARLDAWLLLSWRLRALYTGGAAPGPEQLSGESDAGSCLVDPATGALQPGPQTYPAPPPDVDAHAEAAAARFGLPPGQLIAQQCALEVRYLLVQRDQGALLQTVLIACNESQGTRLWECTLDERARRPRPALRP